MASVMRYRGGVVQYQAFPTANDGVVTKSIEVGDLVYVDSDTAYPASYQTDQGTAAQNRAYFAARFAGVAVQKIGLQSGETTFKLTNDPGWILVATTGDFEFDCASTSFTPGDMVGVYNDGTDNDDQKVAQVTVETEAIGVVKVPYSVLGSSMTKVIVSIRSRVMLNQVVISGQ